MKVEGFSGNDDVRLKTVIRVPKNTVGRIIGKGGKNVREVQRLTGGIVRLPQLDQILMMNDNVHVEVFGNFMATQAREFPDLYGSENSVRFCLETASKYFLFLAGLSKMVIDENYRSIVIIIT